MISYRKLKAPVSVQVEITEFCDNDCLHCYNHWRDKSIPTKLKFLNKLQAELVAEELIRNEVFLVTLTGGEPLLFPEVSLFLTAKLTENNIEVSINSNLTKLTPSLARELKNSGITSILTSVLASDEKVHDSISGRKGSWKETMRGIECAMSEGLRVSANMVLIKRNFRLLSDTAKFLKELGIKTFCATKASPALNSRDFNQEILSREELRESLAVLKTLHNELGIEVDILECYPLCLIGDANAYSRFSRRNCTAGITSCTIGASGLVRPCSHADLEYGNIFQNGLQSSWDVMSDWRDGSFIPNECTNCKFILMCSGGCRMEAKFKGDIKGKDPNATTPEDVIFHRVSEKKIAIDSTKKYFLSQNVRLRRESFGGIISIGKSGVFFLNKDGFELVKTLEKIPDFSLSGISKEMKTEESKMTSFLSFLLTNNVIKTV